METGWGWVGFSIVIMQQIHQQPIIPGHARRLSAVWNSYFSFSDIFKLFQTN